MAKADKSPKGESKTGALSFLRWAPVVLAGVILGLICWGFLAAAESKLPMPFGTGAAVVLSGSMSPALEVDDLIIIQEKESYTVGDIVVCQTGGRPVVHRIIAIEGTTVTTKGDANNVSDSPVDISAVKGKVVLRVPRFGAVINILNLPAVKISVLAGAGFLLWRSFSTGKDEKEEDMGAVKDEIQKLKAELGSEKQDGPDVKG